MGAKHTMGIRGKMGDLIFEKEPSGIPGNADIGNQTGGEQFGTVEIDE